VIAYWAHLKPRSPKQIRWLLLRREISEAGGGGGAEMPLIKDELGRSGKHVWVPFPGGKG